MLKHLRMYYVLVALPYVLLLAGSVVFFEPIKRTILNNPIPHLNYAIIVIVLTGGLFILNNARRLVFQARSLTEFSAAIHTKKDMTTLREMANRYTGALACILQMIASSSDRSISHQEQAALEHELVNARSRLVRRNALPQYLTGLLVAMGLLGTFIGLLATLADISVLIGSFADIDMNNVDPIMVFKVMIERMKAPMTSMGIAFSTSMFGLLGSIIIGLMMLGIRRVQGDIFSVLSSEVARHIEIALSFESISFRGGEGSIGCYEETSDLTAKILLRIEERLAEASRLRQRALSTEIDDFKTQRADMLQVLTEQTEASNNFRSELQQLGSQLGNIFNSMEKSNSGISGQLSELTVHLAGDARETHKLLAAQVDEQKQLKSTLDAYNIEEWLAETARVQQRVLASEIDDFKKQRAEMLQALTEQTEASRDFRGDLQKLGGQLEHIYTGVVKGSDEVSSQISELTVHAGADAKETHRLLSITSNNVRTELQQVGGQLSGQLDTMRTVSEQGNGEICTRIFELTDRMVAGAEESKQQLDQANGGVRGDLQQLDSRLGSIFNATEQGNGEICSQVSELKEQMAAEEEASQQRHDDANNEFRDELQQLGSRLVAISNATEQGSGKVATQISAMVAHMAADTKESQQRLDSVSNDFRGELQQLGSRLASIFNATEQGSGEIATQISDLKDHMAADAEASHQRLDHASKDFRIELQQLGSQLGTMCNVAEKGNGEIATQISDLMVHRAADAKESHKLLAMLVNEQDAMLENEQDAMLENEQDAMLVNERNG